MDERIRVSAERKKRVKLKFKIFLEVLSLMPLSLVFQQCEVYSPAYVIAFCKLLRLLKVWPVFDVLHILKKKAMNIFRIIEVILSYYIVTHTLTCLFIIMMYFEPNMNDTWVRRIPYPFPERVGFREGNEMYNVTNLDIYNHALYWGVNTVSHVAIGDVTPCTVTERIFTAFAILIGNQIIRFYNH
jgi:hypothetical protein